MSFYSLYFLLCQDKLFPYMLYLYIDLIPTCSVEHFVELPNFKDVWLPELFLFFHHN